MNESITIPSKIEKIVEENSLLILSESKVFIKNNDHRISISLSQISNVRVIKNRDYTFSILVLVFSSLFYILVLSPINMSFAFSFLYITLIYIVITFLVKNYTYKLLINKGKFSFLEISISKRNSVHAESFATKFKNSDISKMSEK
ncbi:hypothetical protein [Flavobacterium cellulosilyticum]|uniref:Uncharacterized protein n=1 Tax=Flavobacterium cellulosilyticum TaxID=2541731 RepID=A0A4R5C8U2_9FLAO|nr:hypothetical protein [Flavobacterium cellulosilyticum]TDD95056.1 hypothetical protein E0F76_14840 [Flavobacterium cellulosilyticum]